MSKFDMIIGYSAIKRELMQVTDILKNKAFYEKLGVSAPRGMILYGVPGVGKSLMANAVIEESGCKAFVCRKDQPNGDFVKEIKATFEKAAENAPSIVLLDDMDKFANGDERHPDAEEYVTVQSCIDETKGKEVFVLATVNNLRCLPRSLRRAGRFDRVIEVEAPVGEDAVRIIEHYLKGKEFTDEIDARSIARILCGCSCAEIETVMNEAGVYAGFARSEKIKTEHFIEACMRTVFDVPASAFDVSEEEGSSNLSDSNSEISQIIYHEAGHAVVSELLFPESVTLISAHSRGGQSGGFTSYYLDPKVASYRWRKSRIISALGGMAAVEQRFGLVETGSARDLNHAFEMVREAVTDDCECGFAYFSRGYEDSAELSTRQEQIISSEVEKYYRKAKEILSRNAEFFEKIAAELAKKKLLHTTDIQRIKSSCSIVPVAA